MFRFGSRKDVFKTYSCTIRLLDDNEVLQYEYQGSQKGQALLDYVCKALNLLEKDYFGLRYVDSGKQRHWLDPTKLIWKQVKGLDPIVFCFRVKFYPPDPYRLKEEITRYQMFLQLRRDLLHGRLYCSQNDSALLSAYIIQSELGDYDHEEHVGNYVSEFKLLLKQTQRLEEKITEIHQSQLRGQVPAVAEMNFLRKACILDTYGVDPHPVKDHKGNQLYLGINHAGILTFQGSRKTHHFKWTDIQKINYEGKMFIVHLLFSEKKHLIGFKCPTQVACQHLWRCAVEQRYFFNMITSAEVPSVTTSGGIFSRASRFRFSGRVEKEIVEDMKQYKRDPPPFQRSLTMTSFRIKPSMGNDSMISQESPISQRRPEIDESLEEPPEYNNTDFTPLEQINQTIEERLEEEVEIKATLTTSLESSANHIVAPDLKKNEFIIPSTTAPPVHVAPATPIPSVPAPLILSEPRKKSVSSFVKTTTETKTDDKTSNTPDKKKMDENAKVNNSNHVSDHRPSSAPASTYSSKDFDKQKLAKHNSVVDKSAKAIKANGVRAILVASLSLLIMLSCLLVLVLESDSPLFSELRKIPEMILLRREYYEPTKEYITERMNVLFK